MATNVVSAVRLQCAKALKAGDKSLRKPSEWAGDAGFHGSAASPLRQHMARISGNGCGRSNRYPAVNAEGMLELLDLADKFAAEKADAKRSALSKRIGTKLKPTQARTAKATAQAAKPKRTAKPKATPKAKVEAEA